MRSVTCLALTSLIMPAAASLCAAQVDSLNVPTEVLRYVVCVGLQDTTSSDSAPNPIQKEIDEGRIPHVAINGRSYGSARELLKQCGLPLVKPEGVSNMRYFMSYAEPLREGETQQVGTFHANYQPSTPADAP